MNAIILILLLLSNLFAAPSIYNIFKFPQDFCPEIDADLTDWTEDYFLDSLHSDDNVYARDALEPWTREEYQMKLYGAYDDYWVYFAVKILYDDVIISTGESEWRMDNVKVNPGGQAMAFYISLEPIIRTGPSTPYIQGVNIFTAVNITGNGKYPTYEFAIQKDLIDPYYMGLFQLSIGSEDNDNTAYDNTCFLAVGAEYTGPKQDWNGNPWDNPLYYPTFTLLSLNYPPLPKKLISDQKCLLRIEDGIKSVESDVIIGPISPNPINPKTRIPYNLGPGQHGELKIFDVRGKKVFDKAVTGLGTVIWPASQGRGMNAKGQSSGVYVVQVRVGGKTYRKRVSLIK